MSARLTQEVPAGVDRALVMACAETAAAEALPVRLMTALRSVAAAADPRHPPRLALVAALVLASVDPGAEAVSRAA